MFNVKIILTVSITLTNIIFFLKDKVIYILKNLDCDTRIDVYIGITGILVAIVIFIAEIISNKKVEIYKKLMLERTNIVKNVRTMIRTMGALWIGELIDAKNAEVLYIGVQLIINGFVIYSMIQTFKTFVEAIRLNTDKEYFNKQLKEYVYSKVEMNVKEKEKNDTLLKEKNRELFDFINNSKIIKFESYPFGLEDEYEELNSNKDGYIESYNYHILNKIIENLKKQTKSVSNDYSILKDDRGSEIYICKKIGDKCSTSSPIAYYKNVEKGLINLVNKAITVDTTRYAHYDNEISKILEDIFAIYNENSLNIESDNMLIEFYEHICKNKYESIISIFLEKVYDMHRKHAANKEENIYFSRFLIRLSNISFKNDRYEDFKRMSLYIVDLYITRMNYEIVDLKEIAYRYVNDVFLFNNYSIKRKSDYRYYDIIMANLLIIIKEYLKRKDIDSIFVLFDNIHFEKGNYFVKKQWTEYDIVNFQFIIAIIYFILYVYKDEEKKKGKIDKDFISKISQLVNILEDKIFEFYDMWDIMLKFNKYAEKKSEILHIIETMDLDSDSHKYKNSWSTTPIELNEVLKCLVYMFNISYFDLTTINEEDINREEKYKFERLLKLFESSTYVKLEKKYNYEKRQKNTAIKLLTKVIDIANKKEIEYEKRAEIDKEKLNKFKENILKNSEKKSEIEKLIYQLGRTKESDEKLKRTFGISQLIPRNWFIKDSNVYTDHVAEEYGKAFQRGIRKEIIGYINQEGTEAEKKISEIINELHNLDDYILLANRSNLYNLNYKYSNNHIEINNKKIEVIFVVEIEKLILLRKDALPYIELCMFDDSYDDINVKGHFYIEVTDCSKDKDLRKRIIDNNDWLKEKGNEQEQNDYLKTMCDFKVFKSFRIIESKNKEIYIIEK